MTTRRHILQAAIASAALPASLPAFAANPNTASWPTQALRIVIPFPAGGTSDVIARLMSKSLGDTLGVPVVIENRTGAAGNVGAAAVANATDGHTMLLSDLGAIAISPLVSKDMPYRPDQLQSVTMLAYSPHLLAVHPSVPANTMAELVAWSKTTKINAASAGSGTANHLGVADIANITGMKWQHVPYRGGAQAINDTVAGTTHLLLNGMVATYPLVQAGKLKLIGVSKRTRMAIIASVPTLAEQGVTGFESGTYQGVMVASTMPKAHVELLSAALIRVIRAPELRARLIELGAEVQTSNPADTTAFLQNDRQRWAKVMAVAGENLEGTR
jgi:tripartite-type tricarboxylate transporter receptor subunit TctC